LRAAPEREVAPPRRKGAEELLLLLLLLLLPRCAAAPRYPPASARLADVIPNPGA
jgi:hypothetical protein